MNIPLPTDNMYKFMALFGLALIIAGCFFVYKKFEYLDDFTMKTNLAIIQLQDSEQEKDIKKKKIEYQIEHLNKYMPYRFKYIGFLIATGSILSFFGFALWYFKLQRYQDIKVKNESIELKRKNNL